jgi:hypothetical protein
MPDLTQLHSESRPHGPRGKPLMGIDNCRGSLHGRDVSAPGGALRRFPAAGTILELGASPAAARSEILPPRGAEA